MISWKKFERFFKRLLWKLHLITSPYNVVKLNLPEYGYYDPDARMLHAWFSLFVEYYEGDYQKIIPREELHPIMEELYRYWTEEWVEHWSAQTLEEENRLYEKENEMLRKLISIRASLWF